MTGWNQVIGISRRFSSIWGPPPTLTISLILLALTFEPATVPAQTPSAPTPLVIRPAAEPRPALKYRLAPERTSLVPGNAAIFYHRALKMMVAARTPAAPNVRAEPPKGPPVPVDEPVGGWLAAPLGEIPAEQARAVLGRFEGALKEVDLAVGRSGCDWEFDRRPEGMNLLLPEIQEIRGLARLQALRARLAILDGRLDEAVRRIEDGLTMGRQVAQGPFAIQLLVGVAIDNVMIHCLDDLIQAPNAPNLFWALADRPRPFLDFRLALEGERHLVETELPSLTELDGPPWSLDRAQRFGDEMQRKLFALYGMDPTSAEGPAALRRLGIAAICSKIYPEARRALIASGRTPAEVEAMPVIQVAVLHTFREYQMLRDDAFKWQNLPYWQSAGKFAPASLGSVEQKLAYPLLAMFQAATPSLNAIRLAVIRLDRQLDALQCVELIRLHAASHGGKLPPSLEAITEAPAPLDPATGKPFAYEVNGDTATLSAPIPPGAPNHTSFLIRYTLKLVP